MAIQHILNSSALQLYIANSKVLHLEKMHKINSTDVLLTGHMHANEVIHQRCFKIDRIPSARALMLCE